MCTRYGGYCGFLYLGWFSRYRLAHSYWNTLIFPRRIRNMRCWRTLKVLLNTRRIFSKKYWGDIFRIPPSPFGQKEVFLKSSRPSLPLKKAPPFSPSLSSIVFTPPSVPPVLGDRNPLGREDVTALRCSEPLRYKVGGASKPCAIFCGMGPPGDNFI